MKKFVWAFLALLLVVALANGEGAEWLQWRGPLATGVALDGNPPVKWGEGSNVLWKTAIPGRGHSSPIVFKDMVVLTTAVETDKAVDPEKVKAAESALQDWQRKEVKLPSKILEFVVVALKRSDGTVLWKKTMKEAAPFAGTHSDGSWASGSCCSDGQNIFAYFGSYGLYCLDLDGNKKWEKDFGERKMKANFGEGTSPVLCGDKLILCQDDESGSFIMAMDKATGEKKWKVERDEKSEWATPLIVKVDGKDQIIASATKAIRSYDASSGELLWQVGGMTTNVIPCPVSDGKVVLFMSGFRGSSIIAVDLSKAKGDLVEKADAIAWRSDKDAAYTPSPVLLDGLVYYLKGNDGSLSCVDLATGKMLYNGQKLEGIKQIFASPVGAGGGLYIAGKNGMIFVVKTGASFEILAQNTLDDSFIASPAIVGRELYLRGQKNVYCIGEKAVK